MSLSLLNQDPSVKIIRRVSKPSSALHVKLPKKVPRDQCRPNTESIGKLGKKIPISKKPCCFADTFITFNWESLQTFLPNVTSISIVMLAALLLLMLMVLMLVFWFD